VKLKEGLPDIGVELMFRAPGGAITDNLLGTRARALDAAPGDALYKVQGRIDLGNVNGGLAQSVRRQKPKAGFTD
jgi:hypothetical protein